MSLEGEVFSLPCVCRGAAGGLQYVLCLVPHVLTFVSTCSIDDDDEIVAHLLPCGHDLHNACLKPWVERANSCPICRAKFNSVELRKAIGDRVIDSYAVQDKVQEAEIDPSMVLEDEVFAAEIDAVEDCVVCGSGGDAHSQMYCDGCDKAVHIFCAGYEDAPEVWYCESCLGDIENDTALPGLRNALVGRSRTRRRQRNPPSGRRAGRRNDTSWARVWQEVSRRLDLDLDFPFDDEDEPTRDTRTPQQRREFRQWQRRFEVADRQGVTNRLRDIATQTQNQPQPAPESQEELRAWNAFDKARELQDEPNTRKRKASASPASPREPEPEPRKLKRPRLRRPAAAAAGSPPAESSHTAAQRGVEGTTFLSSLLREVENIPSSAGSPGPSSPTNGQFSPRNSSPARSPGSSGYGSPHATSATPPMSPVARPNSPPMPLFSPFSPAVASQDLERTSSRPPPRGRRRDQHDSGYDDNYHSGGDAASPSRNMSYSAKEEIQRMVKLALRPRYLEKVIDKDQYTDINRDVSRRMYDLVGNASALADQSARGQWQQTAADEVQKAIAAVTAEQPSSD